MNISIVIPVYNEADRLAACLRAIGAQRLKPLEVIVVDNNSSDGTAAVAKGFGFVRLINEPKQGVLHARTTGFDAASGDIIARIDADTVLPPNWTEQILEIFKNESVAAVSGAPDYYDFAWDVFANTADHWFRSRLARQLGDHNFLWGANMALRRSAWLQVRYGLCSEAYMHEDFDLGIHLQEDGLRVDYDPLLVAGVSSRRIDMEFIAFVKYTLQSPKTYAKHNLTSRRHMYPVLLACWLAWLPGRIIYRGYNLETGGFSLSKLFEFSETRVDPTSNIV
jgi:glycosyltransferase involved in cell wall biosynthesis